MTSKMNISVNIGGYGNTSLSYLELLELFDYLFKYSLFISLPATHNKVLAYYSFISYALILLPKILNFGFY
jgi:hypothetical protein